MILTNCSAFMKLHNIYIRRKFKLLFMPESGCTIIHNLCNYLAYLYTQSFYILFEITVVILLVIKHFLNMNKTK